MKRVTGNGGITLKCEDPKKMTGRYQEHLEPPGRDFMIHYRV